MTRLRPPAAPALLAAAAIAAAAACADVPTAGVSPTDAPPAAALQVLTCTADRVALRVACGAPEGPGRSLIFGGQGSMVRLTSSNVAYNAGTGVFSFDATVQNLMNEAIGTPDGTTVDPSGVRVFFHTGPAVSVGTGSITVANPDGTGSFTGANQPYFQYAGILAKNQVSGAKPWVLNVPATVTSFTFAVYVQAELQPLVVINEVMANPGGVVQDSTGEYVEVYNAGTRPVNLRDFLVSDNSGVSENPAHVIASDLIVPSGGYVVLGRSTNTAKNGGIDVDYVYVASTQATTFQFSNSSGDVFRIKAPNGVLVDSVKWTTAATGAANNTARELINPSLDNTTMDGASWGAATTTYETTNKGTPGAQNANFTP